jgi:hypothetical protein
MWMYELRRAGQTLLEDRGAYRTENEAKNAGKRAKQWIEEFSDPRREKLTIVTKPV